MRAPEPGSLTFGFHPTSHGFGWVAFSSPLAVYDWGLCEARSDKNAKCLRRLEKLFVRLEPNTLALEAFEAPALKRSERVVRLCKAAAETARGRRMDVVVYSRDDIKSCFATVGAASRQEIAEAIARSFESLRYRLPKPRRPWDGQPRRMAIFDAAAVVLTHFQLGTSRLFDALSEDGRPRSQ
jgi:Holliday junction resolvasome RuvABC endonuclease subunit